MGSCIDPQVHPTNNHQPANQLPSSKKPICLPQSQGQPLSPVQQLVNQSFTREEGNPLPIHCYYLHGEQFSIIALPDVILTINTREKESSEEAVTAIDLEKCQLGDEGTHHLSLLSAPNIKLWLSNNGITSVGCSSLFPGQWSRNLHHLSLGDNKISDKGCQTLSKGEFPSLKQLHLDSCQIGDEGCFHLGKLQARELEVLSLWSNKVGEKGSKGLSKGDWPLLNKINLNQNKLGEKGLAHLSKARWRRIKGVHLVDVIVGDRGCRWLGRASLKELTRLELGSNGIREKGCQYLSKLEGERVEKIDLNNWPSICKNRVGAWGKRFLVTKVKEVKLDGYVEL